MVLNHQIGVRFPVPLPQRVQRPLSGDLRSNLEFALAATRAMSVYDDLDVREARIKGIWEELLRTPRESPRHRVLVEDIIEESAAYLAAVEAARRNRKLDASD
jgi:hypothetical protein